MYSNYESCGEIFFDRERDICALSCSLCRDVYLQFEDFKKHLNEHYQKKKTPAFETQMRPKQYINTYSRYQRCGIAETSASSLAAKSTRKSAKKNFSTAKSHTRRRRRNQTDIRNYITKRPKTKRQWDNASLKEAVTLVVSRSQSQMDEITKRTIPSSSTGDKAAVGNTTTSNETSNPEPKHSLERYSKDKSVKFNEISAANDKPHIFQNELDIMHNVPLEEHLDASISSSTHSNLVSFKEAEKQKDQINVVASVLQSATTASQNEQKTTHLTPSNAENTATESDLKPDFIDLSEEIQAALSDENINYTQIKQELDAEIIADEERCTSTQKNTETAKEMEAEGASDCLLPASAIKLEPLDIVDENWKFNDENEEETSPLMLNIKEEPTNDNAEEQNGLIDTSCVKIENNCQSTCDLSTHQQEENDKDMEELEKSLEIVLHEFNIDITTDDSHIEQHYTINITADNEIELLHKERSVNIKFYKTCKMCKKKFDSAVSYKSHLHKVHRTDEIHVFKCRFCNYFCDCKRRIRYHMQTHSQFRPFKCSTCGYTAARQVSLHRHELRNTCKVAYKCTECDYEAPRRSCLKFHEQSHRLNYGCDFCPYKTYNRTKLELHVPKHGSTRHTQCNQCFELFKKGVYFRVHQKTHIRQNKEKSN